MENNQMAIMKLTPQQQAWVNLSEGKNNLMNSLISKKLAAEKVLSDLNNPEIKDYRIIEDGLASYRKMHTEMVEERKSFTKVIDDKIVQTVMAPEKEIDPSKNQMYGQLSQTAFKLKKDEADKITAANNKNAEKSSFAAHIDNEYIRITGLYKVWLREEVTKIYESNLKAKIADPFPALDQFKAWIGTVNPPGINGFMPRFITKEEADAIFNSIPQPKWEDYKKEAFQFMDDLFVNYQSALANADQAIAAVTQQVQLTNIEDKEKENKSMALNTLASTAQAVTIQGPVIKKTWTVQKENSWNWAQQIISAFYVNINLLEKYVRVKDWGNLKVSQMADALGKLATETACLQPNLNYEEIEK